MRINAGIALSLVLALALTSACTTTPSYPEPTVDSGQILIELKGEAKDGVTGPKSTRDRTDYESTGRSVEQGKAFERVNYEELEDVVVIIKGAGNSGQAGGASVEIGRDGFSRSQLMMDKGSELSIRNRRDAALTVVGFSADEFFEIKVAANATATTRVAASGSYVVTCDEDETLSCTLFVLGDDAGWIGNSSDAAFFNGVAPGEYSVFVHGPRLPCWYGKAKVTAGNRVTLNAGLTVNKMTKFYGE